MFTDYAKYYDLFHKEKPYKEEIKFVYKWANRPGRILDIGCGTANYWQHYPKRVQLVGIEKSKDMIKDQRVIQADVTEYIPQDIEVDCVTALFDVINYIPVHNWWNKLPLKKGGYFIFDIWNYEKVKKDGFCRVMRRKGDIERLISPEQKGDTVDITIDIFNNQDRVAHEVHRMYLYNYRAILKFCLDNFEVVDVRNTAHWQQWWKLRRL